MKCPSNARVENRKTYTHTLIVKNQEEMEWMEHILATKLFAIIVVYYHYDYFVLFNLLFFFFFYMKKIKLFQLKNIILINLNFSKEL